MSFSLRVEAQVGGLDLSVTVEGGSKPVAIIGPNGAGKSTLLRIIAGALNPASGRMVIGEAVIFDTEQGLSLPPEQRHVGFVPQGMGLFPHLPVIDNVAFGLTTRGIDRSSRHRTASLMLRELGVEHLASRGVSGLSDGESQRVALARALVVNPELMLLDEPMAALDVTTRRETRSFLAQHLLSMERKTIIVTHDARDVVALDADVVVLEEGRVVQRGDVASLRETPVTDFVAEFFGVYSDIEAAAVLGT